MVQPNMVHPAFTRPGFGELPVGSVSAFAGALGPPGATDGSAPQDFTTNPLEAWGWMACDGRTLSNMDYPELFAVLGYVYGGSGSQFRIPDYRGYFLRGNGTGTQNDPDLATRSTPPGGQGLPSGVGSIQSSAVEAHAHTYSAPAPSGATPGPATGVGPGPGPTQTSGGPVPGQGSDHPVSVSRYETRPLNVCVNYIIKFTYGLMPMVR